MNNVISKLVNVEPVILAFGEMNAKIHATCHTVSRKTVLNLMGLVSSVRTISGEIIVTSLVTLTDCASIIHCSKIDGPICYYCATGKWGENCERTCPNNCIAGCKMSSGECIRDYLAGRQEVSQPNSQPCK